MRLLALAAAAVLLAACSTGQAESEPVGPPEPAPALHLALGDSVAAGVGADLDRGYVPLLTERLREECGCPVDLRNLAVGGATTASLLRSQLPTAQELLRSAADVRAVTVTIGGNDVFGAVVSSCASAPASAQCAEAVTAAVGAADDGVRRVLQEVRAAAGPEAPVAVMTYYDPVPACDLAPLAALSTRVLEGDGDAPGLNDVVRARAQEAGAVLVETHGLLGRADLVGGRDCLHPGPTGHERIADAFAAALARD